MPIRVYYEVLNQKGTPALYSDNYAQRPAAGYQGRIFYSPDTAQIFYDTGSTWTLLADAGVGSGSLASVCANGNTTATGISITAGGLSTNSLTSTNLTAGSIPFIGTGGLFSQDNSNLFWDNTNKWLGLNTNTPTAPFDIHTTANVGMQINNTTTADSKIAFLNAGVGKWRIGNLYSGGSNLFHIWNNTTNNAVITINSQDTFTYTGSTGTATIFNTGTIYTSLGLSILETSNTISTSGSTSISMGKSGSTNNVYYLFSTGNNSVLQFTNSANYTYTYPAASGTIAIWSSATTNTLPKFGANNLVNSMLSDDGTSVTSSGATRSNLYLKAVNNTYYGQLAFTNGSNGNYGGISYNNASQYMQFETATSEWARLTSTGQFLLSTTSTGYNNPILLINAQSGTCVPLQAIADSSGRLSRFYNSDFNNSNTGTSARMGFASGSGNTAFYIQAYNSGETAQGSISLNGSYGSVGIGTYTPATSRKLHIDGTTNGSLLIHNGSNTNGNELATWQLGGSNTNNTTSYYLFCDTDSVGVRMVIYGNGNVANVNNSYGAYSDVRLKENITDATSKLDDILKVKVRNYNLIGDDRKQIGVVAQELEEIFPNMIEENENGMKGVKYSVFVPMLIKAVQELNDKIENLN